MKFPFVILLFVFSCVAHEVSAQTDTSAVKSVPRRTYTNRDTLYMIKLNHNSNLMIAGGIGLTGVGAYLLTEGSLVYTTPATSNSSNPAADVTRNHNQGTAYIVAGSLAVIGGAVLTAFGAINKIDFKRRRKMMSLQAGILQNGNAGALLTF